MKSLDLSGLSPADRELAAVALKDATFRIEGGKLRVSAGVAAGTPPEALADLVADLQRTATSGVPDGMYCADGVDPVRTVPVANPFDRNSPAFNVTRQAQMKRDDPELAARCKSAIKAEANPWAAGTFNVTAQMQMVRTDSARAASLKAAAGR